MQSRAKSRTVTFSGCWTCKKRKVKCDEKPGECGNCRKMGIQCGGYGVRLRWRDESGDGPSPANIEGRGKIKLDTKAGSRYSLEEIDDFLLALDNEFLIEKRESLVKGPFCMFPGIEQSHGITWRFGDITSDSACAPRFNTVTIGADMETVAVEHENEDLQAMIVGKRESMSRVAMIKPDNDIVELPLAEYNTSRDEEHMTLAVSPGSKTIVPSSGRELALNCRSSLPMDRISTIFSKNPLIGMLIHHYMTNVSDVLLPVRHIRNPYRNIYAPAAFEVAISGLEPTSGVNFALYNSLLASSAFHLWQCNPGVVDYYQIGTEFNERAVRYLRTSISGTSVSAANYRSLLMTMLSLVDNSLFTAGNVSFAVHVKGATQFRKSQSQRRLMGQDTQQLNEISAFFSLIEGTSSLKSDPTPWLDSGDCLVHGEPEPEYFAPNPGYCFEFQFGITPRIATAIQEVCRLADHLSYYTNVDEPVPSGLLESCETLDQTLLSWTMETETETYITSTDPEMLSIFIHQADAWHAAAQVYNHRRIHRRSLPSLKEEIARVAHHCHAIEDVKVRSSEDMASRGAPMTWPAFVASCDALPSERDTWRDWWDRVQCYGIANYRRQWEVVQHVWGARDRGETSAEWIDILRALEIQILLL